MKAFKYIALGIGTFFGGRYLLSLSRAGKKMTLSVSGKRSLISAQGINIILNYNIKNPSRANLRIVPPLIKLSINEKLIASSTMQNVEIPESVKDSKGRIEINAFSETGDIEASILVPWVNILSVSPQLLARFQEGEVTNRVKVSIETLSHAFTTIGDFPLDDKTTIEL